MRLIHCLVVWRILLRLKEIFESSFLPGDFHGDPADRIIVATARNKDLLLLTRDKKILSYAEEKHLYCLKV